MKRLELLALLALVLILVGVPVAAIGYQYWLRPATAAARVIDITARIPEAGGFAPDAVRVMAGEPVTLRFSSDDVTHGIAFGPGLDLDLGHVDPGKVKKVTLTFDTPGTYSYYCNTWCSPDHWRMRGTIQVIDPDNPALVAAAQPDPVIQALVDEGFDIDAPRDEPVLDIERPLSAQHGASVLPDVTVPAELENPAWRRTHAPAEALDLLLAANPGVSQSDLLDVVAHLWTRDSTPDVLAQAETLYNQNCAACHGQYGGGDGPAAGTTAEEPVAFADARYMFEMRADVLYAKIRRGGMGTDMPNFGTLFTQQETWALVDYLWTLSTPSTTESQG